MRVPIAEPPKSEGDLDVVFLGIPLDTATSNRPGARYLNIHFDITHCLDVNLNDQKTSHF